MSALTHIRNPNAVLRLVRMTRRSFGAARTLPMENVARSRAQSLLAGMTFKDNTTNPGPLTLPQARDVIAWATSRIL